MVFQKKYYHKAFVIYYKPRPLEKFRDAWWLRSLIPQAGKPCPFFSAIHIVKDGPVSSILGPEMSFDGEWNCIVRPNPGCQVYSLTVSGQNAEGW